MDGVEQSRHHMIVVVDVEGFGDPRRTHPHQLGVRAGLYRVMREVFAAVGVPWADCYHEDRGDGMFVLVPATAPKMVFVDTMPLLLVKALRVHNDAHPEPQRIRLRMALHAGEVHHDEHGVTSTALTLAFRLLDAAPLKAALAASPGTLAVITSDWFFEDVVRHHPGAAPDTYRPVSVARKETATVAWIALPDYPYLPRAVRRPLSAGGGHGGLNPWLVPRQLPLAVRDFTGRADHVATLDALVSDEGEMAKAVVISAIDGTAGIGKTTLAVHWAHRVQHHFPDGTLHVNLRGYGPGSPATPSEVLDGFLRALDTPAEKMPVGVDAQAALFRSLVDGRRMLIVLDNANSADQVRPLLPASVGCMVLVTSRDSLNGLVVTETARRLTLDLLAQQEALDLVTGIIGTERATDEPDAVTTLVTLCARLPLALRIAAGKVAAYRHVTVSEIVTELTDEHDRLDALSYRGDERSTVRKVFNWSYQRLPAEEALLFRRLGLHPGPDLSLPAAAAVAELDEHTTNRLLDRLADAHLIEKAARGRYRMHDLLRAFATDLAHHHDGAETCDHALRSLLDWYTNVAWICDELVFPANSRPRVDGAIEHSAHPVPTLDRAQAMEWLEKERANLLAVLRHAVRLGLHRHALRIAGSMRFLYLVGSWDDFLGINAIAITIASETRAGDIEAYFRCQRSEAYTHLRRWEESQIDLEQSLALARTLGDPIRHGWALNGLAMLALEQALFEHALSYLWEALPLSQGVDTGRLEAVIEGNLCLALIGLKRYRQALDHGKRGLTLRRRCGDLHGEPAALHGLARAWLGLDEHKTVMSLCREAISLGRNLGYHVETLARPLNTLATSLHRTGRTAEAITCWREAAALFDHYGRPETADQIRNQIHSANSDAEDNDQTQESK